MLDYGGDCVMPRIKIVAKLWPQHIGGTRYERREGDVVDASDADAARLIKAGAAKPTKQKVNVPDQKETSTEEAPKHVKETPVKSDDESSQAEPETDQVEYTLLPTDQIDLPMPSQAATTELWQDYAIAAGMPEAIARDKKRDELRQLFG